MQHTIQTQPKLQHIRHPTASASPPMTNGTIPQPPRPASRTAHPHRQSALSNAQYTPPQAQMAQQPYGYAPAGQYYNPQAAAAVQRSAPTSQPQQHAQQTYSAPSQPHLQQAYLQDQKPSSIPPSFQSIQTQPSPQPENQHLRPSDPPTRRPSPQPETGGFTSPPLPQPKAIAQQSKSHSIFTPIDDSRSLLAAHWGAPPETTHHDNLKAEQNRSLSLDMAATRDKMNRISSPPPSSGFTHPAPPPAMQRTASTASVNSSTSMKRSNTMQSDAKRPRLKVQIPSEHSDGGEATADSSDGPTATAATQSMPQKGVVLPPPSPSTNNPLLSAGASGPPNPFARPAPPHNQNFTREQIETPLSALPSRIMDSNILPSPSDLWQTMFNRSNNDNMMPSPLRFEPTPIHPTGPSFRDDASSERKRSSEDLNHGDSKRIKT